MIEKGKIVKNKTQFNKNKIVICIITMILIATSFIPIASSCHTPGIELIKTGPIYGFAGDEITYTYTVHNTGDVPLTNVYINDNQCSPVTLISGDENLNNIFETTEIWTFTCSYTPCFTFPNPLTNKAKVYGTWEDQTVYDKDNFTLYPLILHKDVILYWGEENIDYSDPETEFTIKIKKGDEKLGTFSISESNPKYLWLSEGTYHFYEIDMPLGYQKAYDRLSFTTGDNNPELKHLNIITFDLSIEKSGPDFCYQGENIIYHYQVNNSGPASVTPIVKDDLSDPPIHTGGDVNDNDLIDPDETWTYQSNYLVIEAPGSFIINNANVTDAEGSGKSLDYWWLGGDINLINNVDEWSVEVIDQGTDPGCTRTHGYWENHPDDWPVEEITVGGITYTKSDAIDLLKTPVQGDKTLNMFYELVAAKLNVENGAESSCIDDTISDADDWLIDNPVQSGVGASSAAWDVGGPIFETLHFYNIGFLCAPHCQGDGDDDDTGDDDDDDTGDDDDDTGDDDDDDDTGDDDDDDDTGDDDDDTGDDDDDDDTGDDDDDTGDDDDDDDTGDDDDDGGDAISTSSSVQSFVFRSTRPVADANGPYEGLIDTEIIFDGSLSYGIEGEITTWHWDFGDGAIGFGETVSHTYTKAKTFPVVLTVTDSNYKTGTDNTIVSVIQPNRPPSDPEIHGPIDGTNDNSYSYAFRSIDLDKDHINYIINWGDGSIDESGLLPSGKYFSMLHKWIEPGEYTITVTASDEQSSSDSEMNVLMNENIIVDNIIIVGLGILALVALMITLMYIRKGKKKK